LEVILKFGLIFELSVPRPFEQGIERQVYMNSLEQAKLADELGFDQVWAVEHHFMEEYSHCSAPDLFLTAVAMQTEKIRVCHGISVCVPEFNPVIRFAERAAVLDVLSNGRVEVGTGRSSTWTELGGFRVSPESTKLTWDEYLRIIPKMWTQERFSYEGPVLSMPERAILPKPVQKPHPPLWVAVTSPGTEIDAGERGLGSLGVSFVGLKAQEARISNYRRRIRSCTPVGEFVNEQVNTVNFLFCHEDPNYSLDTGGRLAACFSSSAAQIMDVKDTYPTAAYRSPGLLSSIRQDVAGPHEARKAPEGLAYGTPDDVKAVLRRWESIGVDRIVFMVNSLETIPQAEVLASMRLFAKEVMPEFADKPVTKVDAVEASVERAVIKV
jgi:alkanesulfonate monooxygenase SsuD/methylene tetrahydromethanopterin reductase-like flavin-dependent oxidoreductase (luciferase family)